VDVALPPEIVNEAGLKETLGPEGDTDPVRVIVPEKLLTLVRVIVVVPVEPEPTFTEVGLKLMLKSLDGGGLIVTDTVAV
jgi:hypothetical protein